jgi:peptidoglycan/LPS O-acetylase OafA/YrhL
VTATVQQERQARPPTSTAGGRHFAHLDAMRGVAAVAVVATHVAFQTGRSLTGPFAAVLSRLDFGVSLFFLLSGFLLLRPWLTARARGGPGPGTAGFLWRRALRILPAYWVAVAAALVVVRGNDASAVGIWLRQVTFTQIYGAGHLAHGLTQMWSLATEVAFYLVLPLLAPLLVGRGSAGWRPARLLMRLALLELLTLVWLLVVASAPELQARSAGSWLPGQLGWFALGMALAVVEVHLHERPTGETRAWRWLGDAGAALGASWLIALGLFALATTPLAGPRGLDVPTGLESIAKHLLYGGAALFLLLPLVLGPRESGVARAVLASPPLRVLGEISYGVFLYHLVVLHLVFRWTGRPVFSGGGFLPVLGLTLAGSVAAAAASYWLLERRALRLKDRVGR